MNTAAVGESEYRGGAWSMIACHNKDASALLRDSEKLSVQSCPCDAVPEFVQIMEYASEVTSPACGENAGNCLDNAPSGPYCASDARELSPERAALAPKTLPATGH